MEIMMFRHSAAGCNGDSAFQKFGPSQDKAVRKRTPDGRDADQYDWKMRSLRELLDLVGATNYVKDTEHVASEIIHRLPQVSRSHHGVANARTSPRA